MDSKCCYITTPGVILPPASFFRVRDQDRSTPHALRPLPPRQRPRRAPKVRSRRGPFFALLNPRLPPVLTPQTNVHRAQIAFHCRCAVLGSRPAKHEPHETGLQTEENAQKRGGAGNRAPTYGSYHDRSSLTEQGQCGIFVPSRWAGRAARCLRLRGAQRPGELRRHAEPWEKPFPTFASCNTICSPPRVKTSQQRGFQRLQRKKTRLPPSIQPLSWRQPEFTPSRRKIIPRLLSG